MAYYTTSTAEKGEEVLDDLTLSLISKQLKERVKPTYTLNPKEGSTVVDHDRFLRQTRVTAEKLPKQQKDLLKFEEPVDKEGEKLVLVESKFHEDYLEKLE